MSRPEDIPEDVWKSATKFAVMANAGVGHSLIEDLGVAQDIVANWIARAVIAERERCLNIVETAPLSNRVDEPAIANKLMADWIAAAIRARSGGE